MGEGGWRGELQAQTSQSALQASDDGWADNAAGMLTCQKHLPLEEKILCPKCHWVHLNRNKIAAKTRVTYGHSVPFLKHSAFI